MDIHSVVAIQSVCGFVDEHWNHKIFHCTVNDLLLRMVMLHAELSEGLKPQIHSNTVNTYSVHSHLAAKTNDRNLTSVVEVMHTPVGMAKVWSLWIFSEFKSLRIFIELMGWKTSSEASWKQTSKRKYSQRWVEIGVNSFSSTHNFFLTSIRKWAMNKSQPYPFNWKFACLIPGTVSRYHRLSLLCSSSAFFNFRRVQCKIDK